MAGKSKAAATNLDSKLPKGDGAADDPVLPCKKNKDPQLKVKVWGRLGGKKKALLASVAANALTQNTATKTGVADFAYVLPGAYQVKVASVSAPDDDDFFSPGEVQNVTLAKGGKQTLEFELEPRNLVTPKIEVEYKVVLLDRQLAAHQDGGSAEKLWTLVQVSYTESNAAYPFSQDVEFSGAGIKVYTNEACTAELAPAFKLAPDTVLKLYLRGTAVGNFNADFKLKDQADARIRLAGNPARQAMAVVGVEMQVFTAAKAHSKVLADASAVTHGAMAGGVRLSAGRTLMLQSGDRQGRAKLVIKKPADALWTVGDAGYKLRLGMSAASGSVALFTTEQAGAAKAWSGAAREFARSDFSAGDITLWVQGSAATGALRDATLHLGINRAAGGLYLSPKGYGDAARFTVAAVGSVTPAAAVKQYINLPVDAAKPRQGRKLKAKLTLAPALQDLDSLFLLLPDAANKAGLKAALKHQAAQDGDAAVKTSAAGEAESPELELSAYGGDKFKVAAYLKDAPPPGTACADAMKSQEITVWRRLDYTAVYTMSGENYIDAATVVAEIQPAFTPAFIEYTRTAVQTVAANLSCKYIGLYDAAAPSKQKAWPADFSPATLGFAPSVAELADYAGADVAKKALAKTAIEAKAQLWFSAISADLSVRASAWFGAVGALPGNALLAVQYYHPKLSGIGADGVTNFWPVGISVNGANPGSGLNTPVDPDQLWRNVQGFNQGTTSVVFKNYGSAPRLQIVCRHEIGHATKSAFGRDDFGVGDHSASGLMTPYGGAADFSATDVNLLRGWKA